MGEGMNAFIKVGAASHMSICNKQNLSFFRGFLRNFALTFVIITTNVECKAQPVASISKLIIVSNGKSHEFDVELAISRRQKSMGLMYRRHLSHDKGMLFVYEKSSKISMWMKNTFLSLDMLFIDKVGRINYIVERAEPLNERLINGRYHARAVLELNAGTVARLGLKVGDQVRHSVFRNQ